VAAGAASEAGAVNSAAARRAPDVEEMASRPAGPPVPVVSSTVLARWRKLPARSYSDATDDGSGRGPYLGGAGGGGGGVNGGGGGLLAGTENQKRAHITASARTV
jgi:hypothetical protein